MAGGGDVLLQRQLPRVQRLKDQQQGHDLGDAGGLQPGVGIVFVEDLPRLLFHEDGGRGVNSKGGLLHGRDGLSGQGGACQQKGNGGQDRQNFLHGGQLLLPPAGGVFLFLRICYFFGNILYMAQ